MKAKKTGGGWAAVRYTLQMANRVGWRRLWKAMSSKNACKTCALGMGGQAGGMRNEAGHWPEVCKKSLQAMVADMQGAIAPEFFQKYGIAELQSLTPRELESLGRLAQPIQVLAGQSHYQPRSWSEAFPYLAERIRKTTPDEIFFYTSGRSSNEAGFLLQLFARVFGANNVNNCSFYCHQASGVGLQSTLGTSTATVALEDVEKADLFLLIGGNPASNHPRLMRSLMNLRRAGGHVIVINPAKELGLVNFSVPSDVRSLLFGSSIASLYVQPHIGGDIPLLLAVAKRVLEKRGQDQAFLDNHTEGFLAFQEYVNQQSVEQMAATAGVTVAEIDAIAERYLAAKNAVFGWTMGITHHLHGVENVEAIVALALLRGMVGRPGAGLLPIRGHSNVQGIGSVGVTPTLKKAVFDRLENHFQIKLPTTPGLDTMACMDAADKQALKVGICLGGNLYGSNPNSQFAGQAMAKLDLLIYLNTTLNTGHASGLAKETWVLPVLARDEEPQKTTQESMFNYVRISDGGQPRHKGPLSEVQVIATLAELVLPGPAPIDWSSFRQHGNIRAALAKIVPGYEAMAEVDRTNKEFVIPGRVFRTPTFPTPSGKARFVNPKTPDLFLGKDQLRLMTIRSEGQFNTVVYEEEDLYRNQDRRDVILMNDADIKRLGLTVDELVQVESVVGKMSNIRVRRFDVRAGNAMMYYPEANVLAPATVDPRSKTPAFKSVLVTVKKLA